MIDEPLWRQCVAMCQGRHRHMPAILGSVDGVKVLLLDFDRLKVRPDQKNDDPHMDAVEGVNDLEAAWVKRELGNGVVGIDGNLAQRCWPFVALHELVERKLMSRGMRYDEAHKRANAMEREARIHSYGHL